MVRLARALALLLCFAPVALQSKQIDVLAQEVARLNLLLEARTPTGAGLAPSPAEASAPNPPPIPTALPAKTAEPAPPSASAPSGPVHIVTKGETLTAIARHYKVTVPQLLKVNKIADVRKLQIGQTLILPPGAKTPESPTPAPQPQ
jgi:LysM repeat protein